MSASNRSYGDELDTYLKGVLPPADDPRWEHWRKRPALVRMMRISGPCRIVTVDAPTDLPEGWEGWLAIDAAGHPYPLHKDVHAAMYVGPVEWYPEANVSPTSASDFEPSPDAEFFGPSFEPKGNSAK